MEKHLLSAFLLLSQVNIKSFLGLGNSERGVGSALLSSLSLYSYSTLPILYLTNANLRITLCKLHRKICLLRQGRHEIISPDLCLLYVCLSMYGKLEIFQAWHGLGGKAFIF